MAGPGAGSVLSRCSGKPGSSSSSLEIEHLNQGRISHDSADIHDLLIYSITLLINRNLEVVLCPIGTLHFSSLSG